MLNYLNGAMTGVSERIQMRQLAHFYKADPAYATGVAKGLNISMEKVEKFAHMSLIELTNAMTEEAYR